MNFLYEKYTYTKAMNLPCTCGFRFFFCLLNVEQFVVSVRRYGACCYRQSSNIHLRWNLSSYYFTHTRQSLYPLKLLQQEVVDCFTRGRVRLHASGTYSLLRDTLSFLSEKHIYENTSHFSFLNRKYLKSFLIDISYLPKYILSP